MPIAGLSSTGAVLPGPAVAFTRRICAAGLRASERGVRPEVGRRAYVRARACPPFPTTPARGRRHHDDSSSDARRHRTHIPHAFLRPRPGARRAVRSIVLGVVPVLLPMAQTLRRRGDVADRRYHRRAGSGRDESTRHRHGRGAQVAGPPRLPAVAGARSRPAPNASKQARATTYVSLAMSCSRPPSMSTGTEPSVLPAP